MFTAFASTMLLVSIVQAQSVIKRSWPPVDHWTTLMVDGGKRGLMCSVAVPTSSGTMVSIIMTKNATHLYLNYGKQLLPLSRNLVISADGTQVFEAPILDGDTDSAGGHFVMADLPGSILADTIAPALISANAMQIDLGNQRFTVNTRHFAQATNEIRECSAASAR